MSSRKFTNSYNLSCHTDRRFTTLHKNCTTGKFYRQADTSNMEEVAEQIAIWDRKSFRVGDLDPFRAFASTHTKAPIIELRSNHPSTWTVSISRKLAMLLLTHCSIQIHPIGEKSMAVFHLTGIWAWNSPVMTGNYVPPGAMPPENLPEGRM